jgi:hypothetical protein
MPKPTEIPSCGMFGISDRYAREGIELSLSTLADQVGV